MDNLNREMHRLNLTVQEQQEEIARLRAQLYRQPLALPVLPPMDDSYEARRERGGMDDGESYERRRNRSAPRVVLPVTTEFQPPPVVNVNPEQAEEELVDQEFEVKSIIDHRIEGNMCKFRVQWKDGDVTWEPTSNLTHCKAVVVRYLKTCGGKTVVYLRVSHKNGRFQISQEMQEQGCLNYVQANNLPNPVVVSEGYTSARVKNEVSKQTLLSKVIETLNAGDHLVVYDVSRLARNSLFGMLQLSTLSKKGVSVHSVSETVVHTPLTTPDAYNNNHNFRVLLSTAENQSDRLSARAKENLAFRKARGDHIGCAPYGYALQRTQDGGLVKILNEEEQAMIAYIKETALKEQRNALARFTWKGFAEFLNARGSRKRGKMWTGQSVIHVFVSN